MFRRQSNSGCYAKVASLALCAVLAGCRALQVDVPEPELTIVESRDFVLLPEEQAVGDLYSIRLRDGDTLPGVARHFGLGYEEMVRANPGVDTWVPEDGSRIVLPMRHVVPEGPREGVVLNLANMRIFYFPPANHGAFVYTFAVGIGREGWETPVGDYGIIEKKVSPTWFPPVSVLEEHEKNGDPLPAAVPPGPDNPLGDYALRLSQPSYLIHGTNKPYGVGMQISHGCVRLYPEDIETLFSRVDVGASVRIVYQPFLAGWQDGELYLEAHPPLQGQEAQAGRLIEELFARLQNEALRHGVSIDWTRVNEVMQRQDGIPTPILETSPGFEAMVAGARAVAHPGRFHGQPVPGPLNARKWSIDVALFDDETEARRVAAVLNHQGPPIPARPVRGAEGYRVVAGPFENQQEVEQVAARIRRDFEFDAKPVAPQAAPASGSMAE